jgi:hypothetical protein
VEVGVYLHHERGGKHGAKQESYWIVIAKATFAALVALLIVMQTCNFAFMNRFTDGLRLSSEDLAVRIYRETYGSDWAR